MAETTSAPSLREQRVILPLIPTREMCAAVQREGYRISSAELRRIFEIMSIWAPAPPTTLTEAVAAARDEGWQPIETLPYDPLADYDFDLPGDADEGLGYATDTDTGVIEYLVWWTCIGPGRSKVTHWRPKIQGPTTPGGRTDG